MSKPEGPGFPAANPEAPAPPAGRGITALRSALTSAPIADAKTLCERCHAEMYRMHAVWRCPACGYKTDCCGW